MIMFGFICLIFLYFIVLVYYYVLGIYIWNIIERFGCVIREIKYIKIIFNLCDIFVGFIIIRIIKYLIFVFERKSYLYNESFYYLDCFCLNNIFLK